MAASQVEKAFCMIEVAKKKKSLTVVQRRFRKCYGKQQLTRQSIYD
jgi:hypothetical protein